MKIRKVFKYLGEEIVITEAGNMQPGDFVYIDYIGKVKDTGEIFDLTKEDIAKKEGVYDPKIKYRPVPIIVDGGFIIQGMNDALKEMKVGEKKTVEIEPGKAFGERKAEFIKLIPIPVFKENNVDPTPGSYVTINRLNGRVISVDGGRIKVDFNHPLAGKKLEYEIEVKNEVTDTAERIKAIVNFHSGLLAEDLDVEIKAKEADIEIKNKIDLPVSAKQAILETILKWIKDIEKIRFIDIYQKK